MHQWTGCARLGHGRISAWCPEKAQDREDVRRNVHAIFSSRRSSMCLIVYSSFILRSEDGWYWLPRDQECNGNYIIWNTPRWKKARCGEYKVWSSELCRTEKSPNDISIDSENRANAGLEGENGFREKESGDNWTILRPRDCMQGVR